VTVINGYRVTQGNCPPEKLSAGEFQALTAERESGTEAARTLHSPLTHSDDSPGWVRRSAASVRDFFVMPSPLAERAPAVDQILDYARSAPWTARYDGPIRTGGVVFCRLVAIPAVVALRIAEWPFTRPSRLLFTVVTVKFLSFLPPVAWTVDHLIHPGVNLTLRIFL